LNIFFFVYGKMKIQEIVCVVSVLIVLFLLISTHLSEGASGHHSDNLKADAITTERTQDLWATSPACDVPAGKTFDENCGRWFNYDADGVGKTRRTASELRFAHMSDPTVMWACNFAGMSGDSLKHAEICKAVGWDYTFSDSANTVVATSTFSSSGHSSGDHSSGDHSSGDHSSGSH